jgi:hypothetical protein
VTICPAVTMVSNEEAGDKSGVLVCSLEPDEHKSTMDSNGKKKVVLHFDGEDKIWWAVEDEKS